MKERETEVIDAKRLNKTLHVDIESRDREMKYLQDKIDKLSDPITLKFEKDGLV